MSDPRATERTLDQLKVIERPGVAGQTTFYASSTWTPIYYGATVPGATTYTTQVGAYRRIGSVLFFTAQVVWTAATGTGVAVVSLPAFSANVANQWFAVSVWHSGVTYGGTGAEGVILPNTDYVQLYSPQSNAARLDVVVEAAGQLIVTGQYFV